MKEKIRGNEYRLMRICVDKYENRVPVGRLYNPFCPEGMQFTSLMELILEMENLQDEMQFPQPFTSRRSFSEAPTVRLGVVGTSSQEMGRCATFQVRILFRQNASWQGSVLWIENQVEESFRSVLELILLMDSALYES